MYPFFRLVIGNSKGNCSMRLPVAFPVESRPGHVPQGGKSSSALSKQDIGTEGLMASKVLNVLKGG